MNKAKIKLSSTDLESIKEISDQIIRVAEKTGTKLSGPVPLPTKELVVPTLKTPCGNGTNTWERYFLRIHKRLLSLSADERAMDMIMKLPFPDEILVEIEFV